MGCISSHSVEFPNDVHPNIFTVATVNNAGAGTSGRTVFGQLEVTSTDLVLHRRGHDPVRWPLHYVRRYGFEQNIFSFESGRRCESGPGIFTFRCRRARELFYLVQTCIQDQRAEGAHDDGYTAASARRPSATNSGRPHSSANEYHLSSAADVGSPPRHHSLLPANGHTTTATLSIDADDAESVNQVFMEITPLLAAAVRRHSPHRHSSLAATGDLSAQQRQRRRRPHSVEVFGNADAIYCNSGRLMLSSSPNARNAYYVNVAPPPAQINLHNANVEQRSAATPSSAYSNVKAKPVRTLNYVLLDVGAPNTPSSPQSATFAAPPGGYFRTRRLSNQSSATDCSTGTTTGGGLADIAAGTSAVSNYAKIDCTKTRALKDTTSTRRMTDDSSHATSARRTRQDSSAVDGAKRTPNGEA